MGGESVATTRLGLVLSGDDRQAFVALMSEVPWCNAHALARLALILGVENLRANPGRVAELLAGRRIYMRVER